MVNENDVVAVDEIGEVFGDNDRLSALVANMIDADLLVVLTDTDGLYSADPRTDPAATRINEVDSVDASIEAWPERNCTRGPEAAWPPNWRLQSWSRRLAYPW